MEAERSYETGPAINDRPWINFSHSEDGNSDFDDEEDMNRNPNAGQNQRGTNNNSGQGSRHHAL